MKGVLIFSKDRRFFPSLVKEIENTTFEKSNHSNSIKICSLDGESMLVYDDIANNIELNKLDIPPDIYEDGYRYSFLVETRSEKLLCNFINSLTGMDIVVSDGNENLYRPGELNPSRLVI